MLLSTRGRISLTCSKSATRRKKDRGVLPRDYVPRDQLAEAVAARLRKKPGTVGQWLYGQDRPIDRLVALYAAARDLGQTERLERLLAELDALRLGLHGVQLTPALIVQAAVVDADQNERAFAFVTAPSLATLDAWVESLHAERHRKLEVIAALLGERRRMVR